MGELDVTEAREQVDEDLAQVVVRAVVGTVPRATVEEIRRAKQRGIRITGEVTPHHLALTDDAIVRFDQRDPAASLPALAVDFKLGEGIEGKFNATLSLGTQVRADSPNPDAYATTPSAFVPGNCGVLECSRN